VPRNRDRRKVAALTTVPLRSWKLKRRAGGKPRVSETVSGKCEYAGSRDCVSILFGGVELVFVEPGVLSQASSERSRGSGFRHLGSPVPSCLPHICASRYSAASAYLSAAPLVSFSFFFGSVVVIFFFLFSLYFFPCSILPLTRAAGSIAAKVRY